MTLESIIAESEHFYCSLSLELTNKNDKPVILFKTFNGFIDGDVVVAELYWDNLTLNIFDMGGLIESIDVARGIWEGWIFDELVWDSSLHNVYGQEIADKIKEELNSKDNCMSEKYFIHKMLCLIIGAKEDAFDLEEDNIDRLIKVKKKLDPMVKEEYKNMPRI